MKDKQLIIKMYEICAESVKNAPHTSVNIGRLNDVLIELSKRLKEVGINPKDLG